jgi:anthranilate phosphoribosyltransferase
VLLNAGAALFIAGAAGSLAGGIALAAAAIDRGDARRTLERMAAVSTTADPAAEQTT